MTGIFRIFDYDQALIGVRLFCALLLFFAADAQVGNRPCLEALHADLFTTALTDTKLALIDLLEGLVDLLEENQLAVTQTEIESLAGLGGSEVDFVCQIFFLNAHALLAHALGDVHNDLLAFYQNLLKFINIAFSHSLDPLLRPGIIAAKALFVNTYCAQMPHLLGLSMP